MPTWLNAIITIGIMVGFVAVVSWFGKRKAARQRAEFVAAASPLADQDFVREMGVEDERLARVAVAIRRAVARDVGMPAELIRPGDDLFVLLCELTSGDFLENTRNAVRGEVGREYD